MARKFELQAGRTFYSNGRPAFYVGRCLDPVTRGGELTPCETDNLARRIAVHLSKPCPYCNDSKHLSRTRATRLKVGNSAGPCPLCT